MISQRLSSINLWPKERRRFRDRVISSKSQYFHLITKLEGREGSETTFTGKDEENTVFVFMSKDVSSIVKKEVTDIIRENLYLGNNVLYKALMTLGENEVTDGGVSKEEHAGPLVSKRSVNAKSIDYMSRRKVHDVQCQNQSCP